MDSLSPKQSAILEFIQQFQEQRGYMPSMREIQAGCAISSTSVVEYNLRILEEKGQIRRDREISRGINLSAKVPGWNRYWVADDKLKQIAAAKPPVSTRPVDLQLARQQAARAAPNDAAEQERLFQQFLEWNRAQSKR